jgi:hypothetical protein
VVTAKDKFTLSYSLLILLLLLMLAFGNELDRVFNLYLALVPLLIPIIVVIVTWLVALIRNIVLRRWRRLASVVIAPFLAYSVFAGLGAVGINSRSIRFALSKTSYLEQIAQLPKTAEPRYKEFAWEQTGGAGVVNVVETLVFDEGDDIAQIMLAPDQRSAAWRSRMERLCPGASICWLLNQSAPSHSVRIQNMGDHFYVVTGVF